MGIIDQEDIIRHFNPDISDEELAEKLGTDKEAPKEPSSPLLDALRTPVA